MQCGEFRPVRFGLAVRDTRASERLAVGDQFDRAFQQLDPAGLCGNGEEALFPSVGAAPHRGGEPALRPAGLHRRERRNDPVVELH